MQWFRPLRRLISFDFTVSTLSAAQFMVRPVRAIAGHPRTSPGCPYRDQQTGQTTQHLENRRNMATRTRRRPEHQTRQTNTWMGPNQIAFSTTQSRTSPVWTHRLPWSKQVDFVHCLLRCHFQSSTEVLLRVSSTLYAGSVDHLIYYNRYIYF